MEATRYLSIINYSEWEKLCKSYSETHARNAIDKDGIFYFRLPLFKNQTMNRLEQYFDSSASRGWDTLVKLATETSWTYSESQKLLEQKLKNHTDIAKVLYALLGEESLDWVYRRVPALDGLSPIECLETPETIKRLKEALCRMDI